MYNNYSQQNLPLLDTCPSRTSFPIISLVVSHPPYDGIFLFVIYITLVENFTKK